MRKTKKVLSIVVSTFMIAALFAGCGENKN
jgi:hypothetical protein